MTKPHERLKNIEDLDVRSFIAAVRNLDSLELSEKLDGTSFWIGSDTDGKIFTSRPSRTAERYFSESEYPYLSTNNGIRGAHAACEAKSKIISEVLAPGDVVEAQLIYGRQPNSITYGLDDKNFITILDNKDLAQALDKQEASVKTIIVYSEDGENLDRKAVTHNFQFTKAPEIKTSIVKNIDVDKEIKALENYLDDTSAVDDLTNFELMSTSLGSFPIDNRPAVKQAKDKIIATVKTKFKLKIKQELINQFVSKLKPAFSSADLHSDEDLGVEGVILKNPDTGEVLKLTDRGSLDAVNHFNYALQDQLSGLIRTTDEAAPIESRGGLIGIMQIRLASILGNKDLALSRKAKDIFSKERGETPTDTLRNVASSLNNTDFNAVKRKFEAIIDATLDELSTKLATFKKTKDDPASAYRLRLKSGKIIGLSPEIIKRTLLAFAEIKRNLEELKSKVQAAKSFDNLVGALYGRLVKTMHSESAPELSEEVCFMKPLVETKNYSAKERYNDAGDAWTIINTYLATLLMSILIYKAADKRGFKFVKDKAHHRLVTWSDDMSPLNFWGWAVWHPTRPAVAKLLQKKTASQLFKIVRKIPAQWVRFLHLDLSFCGDVPIDWVDHYKTIRQLMQHAPGQNSERIKDLVDGGFKYDELSFDEKVKWLPKLYFYAQQFVPTSPLLHRVKAIQEKLLLTGSDELSQIPMTKNQKLLGEDGEIATSASNTSGAETATSAKDIASVPTRIGRHINIIRRKRNPEMKWKKFERPTKDKT